MDVAVCPYTPRLINLNYFSSEERQRSPPFQGVPLPTLTGEGFAHHQDLHRFWVGEGARERQGVKVEGGQCVNKNNQC